MIDPLDFEGIARLMNSGFTLQETLDLLETPDSRPVFAKLRKQLVDGTPLQEVFPTFCPKEYRTYLSGFLSFLPMKDAMMLCMEVVKGEQEQKKDYIHGLFYPSLMFVCSLAGVILFNEFCLPSLLSLMENFHVDTGSYETMRIIARGSGLLFFLLCVLSGSGCVLLNKPSNQVKFYCLLARHFPASIYVQYESADFIRFFLQCIRMNVSTRESLRILKSVTSRPVIAFLAEVMERGLLLGNSFQEAVELMWLDPALIRFMRIACTSLDTEVMLEGYLVMSKERAQRQCRKITRTVQVLTYVSIGIVLIAVYRILMLPMAILGSI
ncbi:MAG: type II secretion system F family protein [Solobacterium sp.]|nr:type II secretion system F family protein [Solobacterium sp.]